MIFDVYFAQSKWPYFNSTYLVRVILLTGIAVHEIWNRHLHTQCNFWVSLIFYYSYFKNPADVNGFTPLHLAAQNGHSEIYGLMVQNAIEKNPAANNGQTPVDIAKIYDHEALFQFMSFIFWENFLILTKIDWCTNYERIFWE